MNTFNYLRSIYHFKTSMIQGSFDPKSFAIQVADSIFGLLIAKSSYSMDYTDEFLYHSLLSSLSANLKESKFDCFDGLPVAETICVSIEEHYVLNFQLDEPGVNLKPEIRNEIRELLFFYLSILPKLRSFSNDTVVSSN